MKFSSFRLHPSSFFLRRPDQIDFGPVIVYVVHFLYVNRVDSLGDNLQVNIG
jgi:hypothetical protein